MHFNLQLSHLASGHKNYEASDTYILDIKKWEILQHEEDALADFPVLLSDEICILKI